MQADSGYIGCFRNLAFSIHGKVLVEFEIDHPLSQ